MKWGEGLLLASLLLTLGAQFFFLPSGEKGGGRASAAWREQEEAVRQRVQRLGGVHRKDLMARVRRDPALGLRFDLAALVLVAISVGVLIQWARILVRLIRRRPPAPPLGSPSPPAWGLRGIARLIGCIVLVAQTSVLLERAALRFSHPPGLDLHVLTLANTLLVDAVALIGCFWFFRSAASGGAPWRLPLSVPWREVRFSLGSYITCVPLFLLLLTAMTVVLRVLKVEPPPQALFTLYMFEERAAVVRLLLALAVGVGPIAEELFFRGLIYRWLRHRVGIGPGLLASAFLFALLHTDLIAFVPILALGLLFGWVYERTGSLAAPVAVHIFHNGAMLYLASLVKLISSPGQA